MKHSPFNVTMSALDPVISALCTAISVLAGTRCGNIGTQRGNIGGQHGVSSNICDSSVGITPQMCNRVSNH